MDEALPAYAKKIARDVQLLCFDEFHVVDVADAMLLGRLFGALWDLGVVTVATSNWPPDDLYKDGLQRDRFLPFIARLKNQLTLAPILSPTDYRLQRLLGHQVYFAPLGPHSDREMQKLFNELVDDAECQPMEIQLPGRRWVIRRAAKGVVWLDFDEACGEARGASDYLALAEAAQVVFLAHVPQFTAEQRNEAKRLMNLVDILYEGRVRLVMAAAAPPHDLYPAGSHKFEFERTVSRLLEMQSAGYLAGVIGGTDGS
jgi:cell division protein ZapE